MYTFPRIGAGLESKKKKNVKNLDCWPSGRFCVGFIVPPDEQATIILDFLSNFDSTTVHMHAIQKLV